MNEKDNGDGYVSHGVSRASSRLREVEGNKNKGNGLLGRYGTGSGKFICEHRKTKFLSCVNSTRQ